MEQREGGLPAPQIMRFTRGSPDAATTVRARGRVVVIVLPVLALLVLVIAYWNIVRPTCAPGPALQHRRTESSSLPFLT